jgi:small GTP-binding protein
MTATIALVGRPNVGKSTLYNRMIGGRPALVHDTPGLTRDRRYGELDYFGRIVRVIDTGGLDPAAEGDAIGRGIHRQAWRAIEEADALVLVVDGAAGLAPLDAEVARNIRATGKPVISRSTRSTRPSATSRSPTSTAWAGRAVPGVGRSRPRLRQAARAHRRRARRRAAASAGRGRGRGRGRRRRRRR